MESRGNLPGKKQFFPESTSEGKTKPMTPATAIPFSFGMRLGSLNEGSADFLFRDPSAPINSSFSAASLPSSPNSVVRKDEKSFKAILLPLASICSDSSAFPNQ